VLDGGKVVEALLYEETDDPVGVEDEISTLGVLVADDAAATSEPVQQLSVREGKLLTRAAQ
jgi:hypothetical protein